MGSINYERVLSDIKELLENLSYEDITGLLHKDVWIIRKANTFTDNEVAGYAVVININKTFDQYDLNNNFVVYLDCGVMLQNTTYPEFDTPVVMGNSFMDDLRMAAFTQIYEKRGFINRLLRRK